ERVRERHREVRGLPGLERWLEDLRHAVRLMRQNAGFTAVTVLLLALGIGTNCAIFGVVDALLLRALPIAGADRLMVLTREVDGKPDPLFSYPAYRQLAAAAPGEVGVLAVTETFTAAVRAAAPIEGAAGGSGVAGGRGGGEPLAAEPATAPLRSRPLFTPFGVRAAP